MSDDGWVVEEGNDGEETKLLVISFYVGKLPTEPTVSSLLHSSCYIVVGPSQAMLLRFQAH